MWGIFITEDIVQRRKIVCEAEQISREVSSLTWLTWASVNQLILVDIGACSLNPKVICIEMKPAKSVSWIVVYVNSNTIDIVSTGCQTVWFSRDARVWLAIARRFSLIRVEFGLSTDHYWMRGRMHWIRASIHYKSESSMLTGSSRWSRSGWDTIWKKKLLINSKNTEVNQSELRVNDNDDIHEQRDVRM